MSRRLGLVVLAALVTLVGACLPSVQLVPVGVKTSIEKTTVTVKDPQGTVLRVEEKEMVLQEYTAKEAVALTTTKPPALQRLKMDNGKVVEVTE